MLLLISDRGGEGANEWTDWWCWLISRVFYFTEIYRPNSALAFLRGRFDRKLYFGGSTVASTWNLCREFLLEGLCQELIGGRLFDRGCSSGGYFPDFFSLYLGFCWVFFFAMGFMSWGLFPAIH